MASDPPGVNPDPSAVLAGLHWVGVELEPVFCQLGGDTQCAGFTAGDWRRYYRRPDKADWLCPYCQRKLTEKLSGRKVPYREPHVGNIRLWQSRFGHVSGWGSARLVQGDSRRLAEVVGAAGLAVSSPPYSGNEKCDYRMDEAGNTRSRDVRRGHRQGEGSFRGSETYGQTPGQLGNLPPGQPPTMAVSSPPYEAARVATGEQQRSDARIADIPEHIDCYGDGSVQRTVGGIDDFWSASRVILEQVYAVLAPGGHCVWVVKAFVRQGKLVDFPGQWAALCESVGFKPVCQHRAMLVSGSGEQRDAFGQHKKLERARKSFFRRLAEAKGSPCINWEDVRCFVK